MQSPVRFLRLKQLAARALVSPATGRLVGRVLRDRIPCRGCVIDTSSPVVTGEVKAMLLLGMYESAEQRFVARYMRTDSDVVELGSSLGVVTSQIARRLQSGRRIVAVEANEALLPTILANVARNAPDAALTLVHAAIDYGGTSHVDLAVGAETFGSRVATEAGARTRRVPATTLEQLLARESIGDFVLVSDIEGAEAGVFAAAPGTLARCRQILCELHDTHHLGQAFSADHMVDLLRTRHGFRLVDHFGNVAVFDR
jgi:FkbM family methyltransferase